MYTLARELQSTAALTHDGSRSIFDSCIDQHGQTATDNPLVHHVIVRADIPVGSQVAQVTHAAGESAEPRPAPGTIAVALHARDESHLAAIADKLDAAGIRIARVVEDDGHLMAIGVHPTRDRAAVRKVLSSLPLVR